MNPIPRLVRRSVRAKSDPKSPDLSDVAAARSRIPRAPKARAGFTMVEMLLVLVILATLAALVIPRFAGRSQQARETAAQAQISSFATALDAFEVDVGAYPRSLQDLVEPPAQTPNWRGPYLQRGIPLDPWGNPYIYEIPGRNNPYGYDLMSMGPDGRVGGGDDITNWNGS